jgi:hypothetical protein
MNERAKVLSGMSKVKIGEDGPAAAPERAYPRVTGLDFLNRCRPATAAFFRYWNAKRGTRAMPARADLDPIEMKPWLPGVALVEVKRAAAGNQSPARNQSYVLRYRLIGTRPTSLRGREVTGLTVEEGYFGADLAAALENYRLVVEEKKLVYDWDHTPAESGFAREGETLLLPLASDGEIVDMVLVYQEVDQWVWARDDPAAP